MLVYKFAPNYSVFCWARLVRVVHWNLFWPADDVWVNELLSFHEKHARGCTPQTWNSRLIRASTVCASCVTNLLRRWFKVLIECCIGGCWCPADDALIACWLRRSRTLPLQTSCNVCTHWSHLVVFNPVFRIRKFRRIPLWSLSIQVGPFHGASLSASKSIMAESPCLVESPWQGCWSS